MVFVNVNNDARHSGVKFRPHKRLIDHVFNFVEILPGLQGSKPNCGVNFLLCHLLTLFVMHYEL